MTQIGFVTYGLNRALGGIGRYTEELLVALQNGGSSLLQLQAGDHQLPGTAVRLWGSKLLQGLLTIGQAEISWLARQHNLDIVHDPTGSMPLFLTGRAKVTTIHDVVPYIYPETSSRLDWLIYRIWLPLAVRRLDAIITDSEQSKRDIVRYLPVPKEKVTVIPCAVNSNYKPLNPGEIEPALRKYDIDTPYILYVGSIAARKNLPRVLEAYAQLQEWSEAWKLVIVGARKWKSSPVFEAVKRLGLEDKVLFTGYVDEDDLPALYNGADLFVFPSLYEGFGLPVLEAMACGTPVITSNCSSLPEVAGDAALLVDPFQVQAIADGMQSVLADPEIATVMKERGLQQAQRFSWERTACETIAVYEKVLAG